MKKILLTSACLLCQSLLMLGCSTGEKKAGAEVGTQLTASDYRDIFVKNTQNDKSYNGFSQIYDVSVTYVGSDLQTAILQKKSDAYLWDSEKAQEERESLFQENTNSIKFITVLFTPAVRINDLDKRDSVWKIYLDVNGQRYTGEVTKIKGPIEQVIEIYPSHNRFSKAYEVSFKAPMQSLEEYAKTFTITSDFGTSRFEFKAN